MKQLEIGAFNETKFRDCTYHVMFQVLTHSFLPSFFILFIKMLASKFDVPNQYFRDKTKLYVDITIGPLLKMILLI
jgi:hypothetical protein